MDIHTSNFTRDLYAFHITIDKLYLQLKFHDTEECIQIEDINTKLKQLVNSGRKVMTIQKIQLKILFQIIYKLMKSSADIIKTFEVKETNYSLDKDVVFFEDTRYICAEIYNNLSKKLVY